MKLVVCIIHFGDAELLKLKFETFFNDDSINYIVSYNKRNYDEYLKAKEMDILKKNNIYLFSEVDVYWGDFSILESQLKCAEKARKVFPDFSHLIILGARTIPYRNWTYIKEKISKNDNENWLNFNHNNPIIFKYWFSNNEFWANLCLNFEKNKINKNIPKDQNFYFSIKNNFVEKYKSDFPFKAFLYKFFMTKNTFILSLIKNKNNKWNKKWVYFLDNKKYEESNGDILNIIGPNLIFNNREKLELMLTSEEKNILSERLKNKHAPEEYFWTFLYKKSFSEYKKEISHNPFLDTNISNQPFKIITKYKIRKIKNKNPNALFLSRVYTKKEINKFKDIMNF
ncbi:MAG: hypothetical protein ACRDAW_00570 [Metamycoplasmataceae bacterium]